MNPRSGRASVQVGFVTLAVLLTARGAWPLPAPGPLRFVSPTPGADALITTGTVSLAVDAACTFNPATLAVTLNGTTVPAAGFLPFSSCSGGRITSQTVVVAVSLPNGTIGSAPTVVNAGANGTFNGSGTGDAVSWNFDGGAAPATGASVVANFKAAGNFTVRMRATRTQALAASGLDNGNLVTAERGFKGGDPTPDSRSLAVVMPADVDFRNYESSHVHPIALSNAGTQLYAVNTPEGRLAIFDVAPSGSLTFAGDVAVGLDPVSLAVRPGSSEVWVANHLSDTVSVVDVSAKKLVATIAAGDEPTDVAFASGRAFVALAGKEDKVNVYDATSRALVVSLSLFGDDPRALAVNAAGTEVYAVVLESGNKTTALFHDLVSTGGGPPAPNPPRNPSLGPAPGVGLIVKFNPANSRWEDEVGGNWTSKVNFTLPDSDVFVIDADAGTPSVVRTASGVGTILYDVEVDPASGQLWVANTEARNQVRFEPKLRGHLVQTRITRVNPATGAVASIVDVNPHINYATTPGSPGEIAQSLSQPGDGVFTASGATYYQTAFGSRKVGILNAAGAVTGAIAVGGGPSGVALKESASRLYVMNRFDNTISVVNTSTAAQITVVGVAGPASFDPSPNVIKAGRQFLYDGDITSGHGDTACATCHVFGNFDNIAWDLGDPPGDFLSYANAPWAQFFFIGASTAGFDPMKGPMTTQTLRGLKNTSPFHWRGDRQNFQAFNRAFVGLMGMDGTCSISGAACATGDDCPPAQTCDGLSAANMNTFTAFIDTVQFPPNPFRNLDDTTPTNLNVPAQTGGGVTAPANPTTGATQYVNNLFDANVLSCNTCHILPTGTNRFLFNGQQEDETQDFKIPQLRNMYEKIGFDVIRPGLLSGNASNIGVSQQKKGFGFLHDGSLSLTEFLAASVFTMTTQQERDIFAFMMAFPTESAPAIGRQVTVNSANKANGTIASTIATLVAQAEANACDVIVKGVVAGVTKGWVYDRGTNLLDPDALTETAVSEATLRSGLVGADVVTFTGVPPGNGVRLGVDRDRDTWLDRTETTVGTDPADPNSNPWSWTP